LREYACVNKVVGLKLEFNISRKVVSTSPCRRSFTHCKQEEAVLVDMEEGVVKSLLRGPLGSLFDVSHLVTDFPGSANNWAVGFFEHGQKHTNEILEAVRRSAELCDCLQCFFILHSMGGGTGSGLGSYITSLLSDSFPEAYKIVTAVLPSVNDDVITSPYNTALAIAKLTELADCVISVENEALAKIVNKIHKELEVSREKNEVALGSVICGKGGVAGGRARAFDEMNNIVANMLLNLTSSARFPGTMNVDLNELSMNLVPFPRLHYLIAAQSPLTSYRSISAPRNADQIYQDVYSRDYQLISTNPREHTFLATSLLLRGRDFAPDLRRNIDRLQGQLRFVAWNSEGWKVGHCATPPVGQQTALLALSNSTAVAVPFTSVLNRLRILFRKKAHLHHYLSVTGFEAASALENASESLNSLIGAYKFFDAPNALDKLSRESSIDVPAFKIAD
uniref:Tubulin epsilon chain n=1 Tax=Hydatigena taeniaeformis TaxID=6205 RepID=A0A0R3WZH1_HYDTA